MLIEYLRLRVIVIIFKHLSAKVTDSALNLAKCLCVYMSQSRFGMQLPANNPCTCAVHVIVARLNWGA